MLDHLQTNINSELLVYRPAQVSGYHNDVVYVKQLLIIIPLTHVGYEMIDSAKLAIIIPLSSFQQ